MSCSAELLLVAVAAFPSDTGVAPEVAARVAAVVAAEWGVPAESVRLEWGAGHRRGDRDPGGTIRLAGRDQHGWLAVTVNPDSGLAFSWRVRAGVDRQVPVAARPLDAGDRLAAEDVRWERRVVWGRPEDGGAGTDPVGLELRRSVTEGAALDAGMLDAPRVVRSGDPVRLTWERGAVTLEVDAVSLGTGRVGDTIALRAGSTRLRAILTGPGTARAGEGR